MFSTFSDRFWHKYLKRPYRLHCTVDQGRGQPVVLLHGIASSSGVWSNLVSDLQATPCRIIAFDLLGFGKSPKPDWADYSTEDHARAVIASLEKKGIKKAILVGHSMGCLVAVHVAKLRPKLVKHLVLYEMPLYEGLPNTKAYNRRKDLYFTIYNKIINTPQIVTIGQSSIKGILAKITGFEISPDTWPAFSKSLQNTIMSQTAHQDLKHLKTPTDVIYGKLDMLVIRGKPGQIFGNEHTNVSTHTITEIHAVSPKASRFLAKHISKLL